MKFNDRLLVAIVMRSKHKTLMFYVQSYKRNVVAISGNLIIVILLKTDVPATIRPVLKRVKEGGFTA